MRDLHPYELAFLRELDREYPTVVAQHVHAIREAVDDYIVAEISTRLDAIHHPEPEVRMYDDSSNDSPLVQSMRLWDQVATAREQMKTQAVALADAVLDADVAPPNEIKRAYHAAVIRYRQAVDAYEASKADIRR
jgi:hypothetical protein